MKLSINVLTWNNLSTIKLLMDAVHNDCKFIDYEFIFVDNGSTDGTDEVIRDWISEHRDVRCFFIRNLENKGISIGKNQGIDNSFGDYIFMLDGDVVPVDNSIKLLVEALDNNKEIDALGMYPNKFINTLANAEPTCTELYNPVKFKCCCLFYGIFRRSIFKTGLRMNVEGEYGKPGYGWEDHDFFKRMQAQGVDQWVAHINNERGRYYHHINSSIRAMGHDEYARTSRVRSQQFKEDWKNATR